VTAERDLSDCLVRSIATEELVLPKGNVVYRGKPEGLYLVQSGLVRVSRTTDWGKNVHLDFVKAGEYFGECCLESLTETLVSRSYAEVATCLQGTSLMRWSAQEVWRQAENKPLVYRGLTVLSLRRQREYLERLCEASRLFAVQRVAFSLFRIGSHLGEKQPDGSVIIPAITHEVLAEAVGTSREIVTREMNRLRALGSIRYTRRSITAYLDQLLEAAESVEAAAA